MSTLYSVQMSLFSVRSMYSCKCDSLFLLDSSHFIYEPCGHSTLRVWWVGRSNLPMDNFCGSGGRIPRRGTPALRGKCLAASLRHQQKGFQFWHIALALSCGWICGVLSLVWFSPYNNGFGR